MKFQPGDPRINRKGRPKKFDDLRALAQQIAHEPASAGGRPIVIDGHVATVAEVLLRQWSQSRDPRLQMHFIEIAFGKVPDKLELSGSDNGPIPVEFAYGVAIASIAAGPDTDSETPGEDQGFGDG